MPYGQSPGQEDDTVELYSERLAKQGVAAAAETQYYQSKIATLTSVPVGRRYPVVRVALTSVGLDPRITSAQYVRNVLTSDLSDPESLANITPNRRFRDLAAAFSFATDGSVAPGAAQSAAQLDATIYNNYMRSGNGATPAAAAYNTTHYGNTIASVGSVDELIDNDRLISYALTAFGIDPATASEATVRAVLTSDLSDPDSVANTIADGRYRKLAAAFNFDTDGTVKSDGAQSATQLDTTKTGYLANYDDAAVAADKSASNLYRSHVETIGNVDDFINDRGLFSYALTAFGLDPSTESKSKIRQILVSDLSNPASFANLQSDHRYRELAATFNFGSNGEVLQLRKAQSDGDELATIRLYNTRIGSSQSEADAAKQESTYYNDAIPRVNSVDDLLADRRLVIYLSKAFALDSAVDNDTLRKALLSDPMDPDSFVNQKAQPPGLRELAAAFNFNADGSIGRVPAQAAQTRGEVLDTTDAYVRQTMETDAGTTNEGVRLALYFQRKAPTITSALSILADKALLKVTQTALGLPTSMSQAEIETQEAMIEKKLDVKDLQDPAKLEKFLARFSALYDIENGGISAASPGAIILGAGATSVGSNVGLLAALQNMKL